MEPHLHSQPAGQQDCWTYDRYGNRYAQTAYNGSCGSTPGYAPSGYNDNRFYGLQYTGNGALHNDGNYLYDCDAENRISLIDSGSVASYVYDADGNRVRKTSSSGTVDYLYDLAGHVITQIDSSGAWDRGEIYAGGMHLATYDNGTTYFTHSDWLGTERVRSTVAGAIYSTWTSLPFGENPNPAANPSPTHFTGKERDQESGLDYFGARYYASNMGRWMSPDWSAQEEPVPYAKLDDPQSLNLYGYVGNNPLGKADPDGHDGVTDALKVGAGLEVVAPELTPAIVIGVGVVALGTVIADHWDSIKESFPSTGTGAGPYVGPNRETVTILNAKASDGNSKASTGPKAADAPGVTAGGQATDVHGNKLGPSGKPQVNTTQSSTRKGAEDKAKSEGSGAVEHSNPKVGKPHFHPTDASGNKKPTSTHHEYPDK